ncbi:hypothetical protein Cfor_09196 [Coptotermes formosanus]|uniref:GOLD domain-containing protein n=1 Tax=Coptotermes formosanus TaxID=36987 RepID=A0A6L2PJA5_COPFO|nr:hypothetical protein Cfor_09196 [Coptotermes formosanus]
MEAFVAMCHMVSEVRDSKGHILSQKDDISRGKFSFVTENYDTFEICFVSRVSPQQRGIAQEVSLVTKRGVEAKNYEGLGEAAKLKPLEVELKRLEDLSDAIVQDFSQMRKREEEMRDTNESTNSRVLYFSIFSMCCLLGLATWQVLYLRRFFKAKKLIDRGMSFIFIIPFKPFIPTHYWATVAPRMPELININMVNIQWFPYGVALVMWVLALLCNTT